MRRCMRQNPAAATRCGRHDLLCRRKILDHIGRSFDPMKLPALGRDNIEFLKEEEVILV